MSNAYEALTELQDAAQNFDDAMNESSAVSAEDLGLDSRCYGVHVVEDMVIVSATNDKQLQYYGGFEYVEDNARQEFGNWVIYYASECERVHGCIEAYNMSQLDED